MWLTISDGRCIRRMAGVWISMAIIRPHCHAVVRAAALKDAVRCHTVFCRLCYDKDMYVQTCRVCRQLVDQYTVIQTEENWVDICNTQDPDRCVGFTGPFRILVRSLLEQRASQQGHWQQHRFHARRGGEMSPAVCICTEWHVFRYKRSSDTNGQD